MSNLSEHISVAGSSDSTQLGVNHLVIRDSYRAWLQIFKNLGRIYKQKTKDVGGFNKLFQFLCEELFHRFFHSIYLKRGANDTLPDKSVFEKDLAHLTETLVPKFASELNFVIETEKELRKLQRVLGEAVPFINYIVLVRPLGEFHWVEEGDDYDPEIHNIRNSRREYLQASEEELGKMDLVVKSCVYPGYSCEKALFVKSGVIIGKRELAKKKKITKKFINLSNVSTKDVQRRFSHHNSNTPTEMLLKAIGRQEAARSIHLDTKILAMYKKDMEEVLERSTQTFRLGGVEKKVQGKVQKEVKQTARVGRGDEKKVQGVKVKKEVVKKKSPKKSALALPKKRKVKKSPTAIPTVQKKIKSAEGKPPASPMKSSSEEKKEFRMSLGIFGGLVGVQSELKEAEMVELESLRKMREEMIKTKLRINLERKLRENLEEQVINLQYLHHENERLKGIIRQQKNEIESFKLKKK